jgi:hypothetical protein
VSPLPHVLWIGGPPRSGKTTVATRLARRHGLRWYNADTKTWSHRDRAVEAGHSAARRWEALAPEARWDAPDDDLLAMSLHRERGPMVIDDLRALPTAPLVVAEGSTVPASVVSTGVADRSRAVWLIPTASFRRVQLDAPGTPDGPGRLFLRLAHVIEGEARAYAAPILRVDGSKGVDEIASAVEALFADALAAGPRAERLAERRALLREANEAVAAQVRAYCARPWARCEPETVVRTFVCECGDPACAADVRLRVGDLAAGPVLAPGHG